MVVDTASDYLDFSVLPELPNIGLAGVFAGIIGDELFVADGADLKLINLFVLSIFNQLKCKYCWNVALETRRATYRRAIQET